MLYISEMCKRNIQYCMPRLFTHTYCALLYKSLKMFRNEFIAGKQQRHRPACASTQSDHSLPANMISKLALYIIARFQLVSATQQALSTAWSTGKPEDSFFRDAAHLTLIHIV